MLEPESERPSNCATTTSHRHAPRILGRPSPRRQRGSDGSSTASYRPPVGDISVRVARRRPQCPSHFAGEYLHSNREESPFNSTRTDRWRHPAVDVLHAIAVRHLRRGREAPLRAGGLCPAAEVDLLRRKRWSPVVGCTPCMSNSIDLLVRLCPTNASSIARKGRTTALPARFGNYSAVRESCSGAAPPRGMARIGRICVLVLRRTFRSGSLCTCSSHGATVNQARWMAFCSLGTRSRFWSWTTAGNRNIPACARSAVRVTFALVP